METRSPWSRVLGWDDAPTGSRSSSVTVTKLRHSIVSVPAHRTGEYAVLQIWGEVHEAGSTSFAHPVVNDETEELRSRAVRPVLLYMLGRPSDNVRTHGQHVPI